MALAVLLKCIIKRFALFKYLTNFILNNVPQDTFPSLLSLRWFEHVGPKSMLFIVTKA